MTGTTRKIQALNLPGLKNTGQPGDLPRFIDVDPKTLFVDDEYQRNLSNRSVRLIRKIITEWNWNSFKPPVTVEVEGQLHVLDGQHTATAAATHPEIDQIPVMIVPAETRIERASAFVRHNQNRLAVTPMQLFYSQLAAGDEQTTSANMALTRAGVTLLKTPPAQGRYSEGETLAATSLLKIVDRRFPIGLRQILEICKEGKLKPISADALKAVDLLLFSPDYKSKFDESRLALTIQKEGEDAGGDVAALRAAHNMPKFRAMAAIWFRKTRKRRS
ncbi:hypothetical protein ACQU0X_30850 [Pseudovibrio ascidiaceicola]|uniref:hypothetical protein n=1 Tax=Pseudovibrio ascidiaceicola TaxID=285279 RepID=UPI003D36A097